LKETKLFSIYFVLLVYIGTALILDSDVPYNNIRHGVFDI